MTFLFIVIMMAIPAVAHACGYIPPPKGVVWYAKPILGVGIAAVALFYLPYLTFLILFKKKILKVFNQDLAFAIGILLTVAGSVVTYNKIVDNPPYSGPCPAGYRFHSDCGCSPPIHK
jgi:hypothetical protein